MINTSIVENLKRQKQGVPPFIDVEATFYPMNKAVDSWFYIGRFESEGQQFTFLFHLMAIQSAGSMLMNCVFSITNKTTGWYRATDSITPLNPHQSLIEDGQLHIHVPNGELRGNMNAISINAQMPDCSLAIEVSPMGRVIYNGGTGLFPLLAAMDNCQYSCPDMIMNGDLVIEGKTYNISDGSCWFDRQFNSSFSSSETDDIDQNEDKDAFSICPKWLWHGIKLDNGVAISLWDIPGLNGISHCFATLLHPDGTQTVSAMKSVIDSAEDIWVSPVTDQHYPTKWHVDIPDFKVDLVVVCDPPEQEIVSEAKSLNKYEAESRVTGFFNGEKVTGVCCVELLGAWN